MYRNLICGVDEKIPLKDGSLVTSINFDNAATTPPLKTVLQEIIPPASPREEVYVQGNYL